MRQRLMAVPFWCGRPIRGDDSSFEVAGPISSIECAAPGDHALLKAAATRLVDRLPQGRPFGSVTLVTGLPGGRSALVVSFHHVLADCIGGLTILSRLVDGYPLEPGPWVARQPPCRWDPLVDVVFRRWEAGHGAHPLSRIRAAAAELWPNASTAPRCSLIVRSDPAGRSRWPAPTPSFAISAVRGSTSASLPLGVSFRLPLTTEKRRVLTLAYGQRHSAGSQR